MRETVDTGSDGRQEYEQHGTSFLATGLKKNKPVALLDSQGSRQGFAWVEGEKMLNRPYY